MSEFLLKDTRNCVMCSESSMRVTLDHVIPLSAGKRYPELFGRVVFAPHNLIPLCRPHHDDVEDLRGLRWESDGLIGLVRFFGETTGIHYPRYEDARWRQKQHNQFRYLLKYIINQVPAARGSLIKGSTQLSEAYRQIARESVQMMRQLR